MEQKVLDNLPGLAAMYMMQQQSLLSVMGMQGVVPVSQMQAQMPMPQMSTGMPMSGQVATPPQELKRDKSVVGDGSVSGNMDYTEENVNKYQMDPDINELLDFSFCGE